MTENEKHNKSVWRETIHEVIFEADTPTGRTFDLILIFSILTSVLIVMLDSVAHIHAQWGTLFYVLEWFFTLLFTAEYVLRLMSVRRPRAYAKSFFGIIDLVAIIPTYISVLIPGAQYLLVVRILRVLRIFRVLKFFKHLNEAKIIAHALKATRAKITVFLFVIVVSVVILGSIMYLIEGEESGFTSIPRSIYWAIVTLTTVGYGDISPASNMGQALAAVVMLMGYAMIAVPTGIVTAEITASYKSPKDVSTQSCPGCSAEGHSVDAVYCQYCGDELNPDREAQF